MSELSKWLRLYCLASTAGMIARSEPAPPVPSPYSVSKPNSPVPVKLKRLAQLSPPPAFETVAPENASAAPPGPGQRVRADARRRVAVGVLWRRPLRAVDVRARRR